MGVKKLRGVVLTTELTLLIIAIIIFATIASFGIAKTTIMRSTSPKTPIAVLRASAERITGGVVVTVYVRNVGNQPVDISMIGLTDGYFDCPMSITPTTVNPGEIKVLTGVSPCGVPTLIGTFAYVDLGGGYRVGNVVFTTSPGGGGAPPIVLYNYGSSQDPQFIIYIDYSSRAFTMYTASGSVIVSGPFLVFPEGSDITDPLRNYAVVAVQVSPSNANHIATVYANGRRDLYLPAMPGAVFDWIIVWEDLVGSNPPGSPNIDGNGDEWFRVTYFPNGTWRIAGYIASGGYRHAVYIGNTLIYDKPYNTAWTNVQNGVYYEFTYGGLPKYVTP